jgi:hypothetical protein
MKAKQSTGKKPTSPIAFYVGCYQKAIPKLRVGFALSIKTIKTFPYNYAIGECNVDKPLTGALFRGDSRLCQADNDHQNILAFCFFFFLFFFFFETGFLCIALAVLELTLKTRLALNSEICLPLPPKCWD